jgi:anti-sigma regulatory factor (Ser/Thr protein kinase)
LKAQALTSVTRDIRPANRPTRVDFTLLGGPRAAVHARQNLAAWNGFLSPEGEALVSLLLTELVTNAVRHGGAGRGERVDVTLDSSGDGLRVAVTDPGAGFDWRGREAGRALAEGGYGLLLVDQMATAWGIERRTGSTTVWFELAAG